MTSATHAEPTVGNESGRHQSLRSLFAVGALRGRRSAEFDDTEQRSGGKSTGMGRSLWEMAALIIMALAVALLFRTFVIKSFSIPSASMEPTLLEGDRVLVNRLAYDAHDPRRGDVVVFARPANAPTGSVIYDDLIKRVIALPGETVSAHDGKVFINGSELREPYVLDANSTIGIDTPVTVPAGMVWVMGDNRMDSADSRVFGPIDEDTIVGRAFARFWPLHRIGYL